MSDPYGIRRVLEPRGAMPQPAWRLDATAVCSEDEVLIDVSALNVDAASFQQIIADVGRDEHAVSERILSIIRERGKLHNPVTGSGGMLLGTVREIGVNYENRAAIAPGDRIATLVSLSLTPLHIEAIHSIHLDTGQVVCSGTAVLFSSGLLARLPSDLPEALALAVCDVCGAPAQVARICQPGQTVAIFGGGGKSGMLSAVQARRKIGETGRLITFETAEKSADALRELGCADHVVLADARDPVQTLNAMMNVTDGVLADVTINCVSAPGTELASILVTRTRGLVYFFSMATSFTAAALGAEGVGKDVDMLIGNGYAEGHAELAFELVRDEPKLQAVFAAKLAQPTGGGTPQ